MRADIPERRQRSRRRSRRNRRGEDERARIVANVIDYRFARDAVAAQTCQRFRECAHDQVDFVFQTEIARRAATAFTDYAQTMRVVDHHARAVFPRERYDFRQLCDVAAHAEYAVGYDQAARRFRHLFQLNFQLLHVRMGIGEHSAVAQLAAVVNAGVIFLVADHVIAVPDDCGNDAEIRLKAGRERAAGFLVQEIRQFLLQLQMQLQRAVQKA